MDDTILSCLLRDDGRRCWLWFADAHWDNTSSKLLVLPRGMKRFVKFFEILSIPSIIWGLIYSSFFGQSLPKELFGIRLPFPILSTTDDVNTILILSVIFGLIQILVGLFVAAKENIRRKDYLSAVSDGFAWQGILIGIVIALVGAMLIKIQHLFTLALGYRSLLPYVS